MEKQGLRHCQLAQMLINTWKPDTNSLQTFCRQEAVIWWKKKMCTESGSRFQACQVSTKLSTWSIGLATEFSSPTDKTDSHSVSQFWGRNSFSWFSMFSLESNPQQHAVKSQIGQERRFGNPRKTLQLQSEPKWWRLRESKHSGNHLDSRRPK